jgi:DivIVA domain-containing protein
MADSSSPAAVATASFSHQRKGYDQSEVRAFLQQVSAALGRTQAAEADLMRQLTDARVELDRLRAKPPEPSELDEATVSTLLGQEAARVLTTAREGAASLRARVENEVEAARIVAEGDIARTRSDADEETARQRATAEEEAALIRKNAAENAERETETAKTQGREMVMEARAYRERVMADLARRRELARQQIEILRQQRARLRASFSTVELALSEIRGELADDIPDPDPLEDPSGISGAFPVVAVVTATPSTPSVSAHVSVPVAEPTSDVVAPSTPAGGVVTGGFTIGEYLPPSTSSTPVDKESSPAISRDVAGSTGSASVSVSADADTAAGVDAEPMADAAAEVQVDSMVEGAATEDLPIEPVAVAGDVMTDTESDEGTVDPEVVPVEPSAEIDAAYVDASPEAVQAESGDLDRDVLTDALAVGGDSFTDSGVTETPDATEANTDRLSLSGSGTSAELDEANADRLSAGESRVSPEYDAGLQTVGVDGRGQRPVDDLFARIRAGRVSEVADLQEMPTSSARRDAANGSSLATKAGETAAAADDVVAPLSVMDGERASEVLEARAAALGPLEVSLGRRLKRALADEQSEALDLLRRRKTNPSADELFGSSATQASRYREAARDDLHQAARAGASSLATLDSAEVAEVASAEDVIGHALDELERELAGPLRTNLQRTLEASGEDTEEAATLLRATYREWKVQRIDALVAHLTLTAYGRGAFAALMPGTPVCWIVDEVNAPCAEGDDNALGGSVPCGEEFPTGHRSVPAYPGCRCALAPAGR